MTDKPIDERVAAVMADMEAAILEAIRAHVDALNTLHAETGQRSRGVTRDVAMVLASVLMDGLLVPSLKPGVTYDLVAREAMSLFMQTISAMLEHEVHEAKNRRAN